MPTDVASGASTFTYDPIGRRASHGGAHRHRAAASSKIEPLEFDRCTGGGIPAPISYSLNASQSSEAL